MYYSYGGHLASFMAMLQLCNKTTLMYAALCHKLMNAWPQTKAIILSGCVHGMGMRERFRRAYMSIALHAW
jgi:hypothetical protein